MALIFAAFLRSRGQKLRVALECGCPEGAVMLETRLGNNAPYDRMRLSEI
jgi:hypothetical protein